MSVRRTLMVVLRRAPTLSLATSAPVALDIIWRMMVMDVMVTNIMWWGVVYIHLLVAKRRNAWQTENLAWCVYKIMLQPLPSTFNKLVFVAYHTTIKSWYGMQQNLKVLQIIRGVCYHCLSWNLWYLQSQALSFPRHDKCGLSTILMVEVKVSIGSYKKSSIASCRSGMKAEKCTFLPVPLLITSVATVDDRW